MHKKQTKREAVREKMKKKIAVLIGIAVCAILLTSPVLASGGYSKIYGNANEDDVLDMRDVTYIKLVIFGKKPATTFADANYDGKISMLDIGQTKLIILGKEKQLTLLDQADRTLTVPRPIERIVSPSLEGVRTMLELGVGDKIVGVSSTIDGSSDRLVCVKAYPELKELPVVGYKGQENLELMVSLKPDVIFTSSSYGDITQEKTGIPVVCIIHTPSSAPAHIRENPAHTALQQQFEAYRVAGRVIEKEERVEELISYINEELDKVRDVTLEIPHSEKPKVLFTRSFGDISSAKIVTLYDPIDVAGGINVASGEIPFTGSTSTSFLFSKEQVIAWDPDVILIHGFSKTPTYTIESILLDLDLQTVNAVKNRRVYYTKGWYSGWDPATGVAETFYMTKLFHPDKFKDLDVEEEGNEILKRFYGVDGLYTWMLGICDYYNWE